MIAFSRLSGLTKPLRRVPMPALGAAWLASIVVAVSLTGAVVYKMAESKGYDHGFTAGRAEGYDDGKTAGFSDGKAEGLQASQSNYDSGFNAGKNAGYSSGRSTGLSTGYDNGYSAAMNETTQAIEEYLPQIIELAYNSGRVSAPVYVPSFGLGSSTIYCTSTDLGSYTSVRCY